MSKPMTCAQAVKRFFSYLDRALTGEPLEDLERHLETCLDCCDRLQFSRQLDAFVRERCRDEPLTLAIEARLRARLQAARTKAEAS